MPLVTCVPGSFILTVFLLQWWQLPSYPPGLFLFLLSTACCAMVGAFAPRTRTFALALLLSVCGAVLALVCVTRAIEPDDPLILDLPEKGTRVLIEGKIAHAPEERRDQTLYVVQASTLRRGLTGSILPFDARILVTDRSLRIIHTKNSTVRVSGMLLAATPAWYKDYLRLQDIDATMPRVTVDLLQEGDPGIIGPVFAAMRTSVQSHIQQVFPEPGAALLAGLLTGMRQDMPGHLQEDFRTTGLTHIVAVSGSNITIILVLFSHLLFFLPLRWRFLPSVLGIVVFVIFVGGSASAVRAAIMGILGLLALQTGRQTQARLSILWTAFFMLLFNPLSLWFDAGFQLSFLAVLGLSELTPQLQRYMTRIPETFGLKETLIATLCAQIAAVPWVTFRFQQLSLIAPLSNLVIVPLVPYAMLAGFIGTVAGYVWIPLGKILGWPGYLLLQFMIGATSALAKIPYAALEIPAVSSAFIVVYYATLAGIVTIVRRRRRPLPAVEESLHILAPQLRQGAL